MATRRWTICRPDGTKVRRWDDLHPNPFASDNADRLWSGGQTEHPDGTVTDEWSMCWNGKLYPIK